jgi:DNA-binding MurR/RpiR family transcriptional regulator
MAPSVGSREDVVLRNRLAENVLSNDLSRFGAAAADLTAEEMINNVQEFHAAWHLLGESATSIILKLFENNRDEIRANRKQNDLDKLRKLCSATSPLEEWKTSKVALWGAGGRCLNIAGLLTRKLDVSCIFDGDPAKDGNSLSGIPISLPP